jgi:hypothetical protein
VDHGRTRIAPLAAAHLAAGILAAAAGCDQASSDFGDASSSLFPPSPAEAGRWAVDDSDPENQRRGVLLLGNAGFGGEPVYVNLYRLYIEENSDPVVKATAIQALARHANPDDAVLVAKQLDSKVEQIRVAAAKGLQRIHNPKIADLIWKKMINEDEVPAVRVELAIALGQYPTRDVFEALCSALDDRELAVNLAAANSLRLLTGADFGLEAPLWRSWADATPNPLRQDVPFYYPTFERELGFGDYLLFWMIPTFEQPGVPAGMRETAPPAGGAQDEFANIGEKG